MRRLSSNAHGVVGVVGAGNMGRGIAASLARSGFGVAQYDITADLLASSAAQHEAIQAADSLAVLCRLADAGVVVSVAGEAAERAVFLGPGGLCEVAPAGALLVDCGTVTVDFARELHGTCAARGLRFLDAPVSGGPEGAAKGTLSIMAGGAAADFEAARPVLDGMGGYVVRMGDGGAGALAKLINQLLTASNSLAASEALALARRSGLDDPASLKALLALLERSWGNSTMLQRAGGIVADAVALGSGGGGGGGGGGSVLGDSMHSGGGGYGGDGVAIGGGGGGAAAAALPPSAAPRNFAKDLDFVLAAAASAKLQLRRRCAKPCGARPPSARTTPTGRT